MSTMLLLRGRGNPSPDALRGPLPGLLSRRPQAVVVR